MGEPDLKSLVAEKVRAVQNKDYFELLGISADASKPEVQKAYFDLAKQLHPDKLAKFDLGEHEADAAKLFKELSDAYNTLMDPRRRARYVDENPAHGTGPVETASIPDSTVELLAMNPGDPDINQKEAAKIFYHKGSMQLKKGAFSDAERLLLRALEADPDSGRYALQLGWAIFQSPERTEKKRLAESRTYLETAVGKDPENPEAHYYMARWFKQSGDMDACRKHLKLALSKRENYIEAKRELRLLDMRAKKGSGTRTRNRSEPEPAKGGKKYSAKGKGKGKAKDKEEDTGGRWPFGLDKLFKRR